MRRVPMREVLVVAAAFAAVGLSACKSAAPAYAPASPSATAYRASQPAQRPFRPAPIRTASAAPAPAPVVASAPAPAAPTVASVPCVNATCPVLVGNPVNPVVTTSWNGKTVGFCCAACRAKFEASPARFVANLPGGSAGSLSEAEPVRAPSASRAEPAARNVPPPLRTSVARIVPPSTALAPKPVLLAPAVVAPVSAHAPKASVAPIVLPSFGDRESGEECESEGECVGGSCRVPGAPR